MGEESKALKDHADLVTAQMLQRSAVECQHVLAVDPHLALGRVDQPVDMADHRGLARSTEPHDDLDRTRRYVEADVPEAQYVAVGFQKLLFAHAFMHERHHRRRVFAEDLVKAVDLDASAFAVRRHHDSRFSCTRLP